MLHAVLDLEWWRVVWIPIAAAIATWLTARGKTAADTLGTRDGALQTREDKLFARFIAEIARLEKSESALRAERDQKDVEISDFREYSSILRHYVKEARQRAESLLRQTPPEHRPVDEFKWDVLPHSPDVDDDDEPSRGGPSAS